MKIIILNIVVVLCCISCAKPKAIFVVEYTGNRHAPSTVNFINKSSKSVSYLWDFGDGNISSDINPIHRYLLSGKYIVNLKAINGKRQHQSIQEVVLDPPHHCLLEMQTTLGTMTIQLYDETPLHRDNFIRLAESGFYDGLLFHRVIKGFMIQGGDPDSKNAIAGKRLGTGGPGYTIPAEFVDTLVHVKGALAAARMGDGNNPKKESSGSQFYIVDGKTVSSDQLETIALQKGITYTQRAKDILMTNGGTPFLDKEYTVFGRVIKGLEVIEGITSLKTDGSDRPTSDAKILSVKIIK